MKFCTLSKCIPFLQTRIPWLFSDCYIVTDVQTVWKKVTMHGTWPIPVLHCGAIVCGVHKICVAIIFKALVDVQGAHSWDERLEWICPIRTKDDRTECDMKWEHVPKYIQLGLYQVENGRTVAKFFEVLIIYCSICYWHVSHNIHPPIHPSCGIQYKNIFMGCYDLLWFHCRLLPAVLTLLW